MNLDTTFEINREITDNFRNLSKTGMNRQENRFASGRDRYQSPNDYQHRNKMQPTSRISNNESQNRNITTINTTKTSTTTAVNNTSNNSKVAKCETQTPTTTSHSTVKAEASTPLKNSDRSQGQESTQSSPSAVKILAKQQTADGKKKFTGQ